MDYLSPPEQKALYQFKQKVAERFGSRLKEMKLFGSIVRGERWEWSDIDILVLIDKLTHEEKLMVWEEETNVNIECSTILSSLVMTPEEFQELRDRERRIALDIDREGIPV